MKTNKLIRSSIIGASQQIKPRAAGTRDPPPATSLNPFRASFSYVERFWIHAASVVLSGIPSGPGWWRNSSRQCLRSPSNSRQQTAYRIAMRLDSSEYRSRFGPPSQNPNLRSRAAPAYHKHKSCPPPPPPSWGADLKEGLPRRCVSACLWLSPCC